MASPLGASRVRRCRRVAQLRRGSNRRREPRRGHARPRSDDDDDLIVHGLSNITRTACAAVNRELNIIRGCFRVRSTGVAYHVRCCEPSKSTRWTTAPFGCSNDTDTSVIPKSDGLSRRTRNTSKKRAQKRPQWKKQRPEILSRRVEGTRSLSHSYVFGVPNGYRDRVQREISRDCGLNPLLDVTGQVTT